MAAQQIRSLPEFSHVEECEVSTPSGRTSGPLLIGPRPKLLASLKPSGSLTIRNSTFNSGAIFVKKLSQDCPENFVTDDETEYNDKKPPALISEQRLFVNSIETHNVNQQKPKLKLNAHHMQSHDKNLKVNIQVAFNQEVNVTQSPSTSSDNSPNSCGELPVNRLDELTSSQNLSPTLNGCLENVSPSIGSSPELIKNQTNQRSATPLLKSVLEKKLNGPLKMTMASYKKLEQNPCCYGPSNSPSILVSPSQRKTTLAAGVATARGRSPSTKKVSFSPNTVYFIYRT